MKSIIIITICIQLVFGYHDPDLNYHLSKIQTVPNCNHGYSYAAPAVQLTTTGIKSVAAPAPAVISQSIVQAPTYQYSGQEGYSADQYSGQAGYSTGITYQSEAPKITYAAQPVSTYQTSSIASNYATAQGYNSKEVHGYATSAGLSSASSNGRTVTPLATYAQAPIIAKVTAAPLIAKFSISPVKPSYVTQNLVQQVAYSGSLAKASLNSYSNVQSGGPVVSQVYAAPSSGYATSPALKVQQQFQQAQYIPPVQYSSAIAPTVAQYHQVQHAPAVAQYSSSSVAHGSSSAVSSQYFSPALSQHSGVNIAQYSAPIVTQHSAPQYAAPVIAQYSAPAVVQHSSPAIAQYSAPAVASVTQYASAPVSVSHVAAPSVAAAGLNVASAHLRGKNVHTEFLENYDAHPRYAFEYSVNDPHTGDIKQQKEERDGEVVKGQYSLVEPDGSVRTVNYVADWETGFHADVRNSKDNQH